MEDSFSDRLSDAMEKSYVLFSRVEQSMLTKSKRLNLSICELNFIEAVNKNPLVGKTVGEIASELMITPASVTAMVNKLEKKGYVTRKKSIADGRQVYVQLTDSGRHADRIHKRFHRNMAKTISSNMSESEKNLLVCCIDRINIFLNSRLKKMEEFKS